MENQRQRWVNIVFTTTALIVAVVAFIGLSKITAVYNFETVFKHADLTVRLVSLVLGIAVGFGLYLNDKSNAFMNEVVIELSRVTWPTTNDTYKATFLVVVFVLVAGMILGLFDSFWSWIMKMVLGA